MNRVHCEDGYHDDPDTNASIQNYWHGNELKICMKHIDTYVNPVIFLRIRGNVLGFWVGGSKAKSKRSNSLGAILEMLRKTQLTTER